MKLAALALTTDGSMNPESDYEMEQGERRDHRLDCVRE